eukprot:1212931-Pyramimonas_sp.AAC.1
MYRSLDDEDHSLDSLRRIPPSPVPSEAFGEYDVLMPAFGEYDVLIPERRPSEDSDAFRRAEWLMAEMLDKMPVEAPPRPLTWSQWQLEKNLEQMSNELARCRKECERIDERGEHDLEHGPNDDLLVLDVPEPQSLARKKANAILAEILHRMPDT